MTCAHVLGLIDAGPFAGYSPAHLESARRHARQCGTCGPAMEAAAALTRDLAALPELAAPPDLKAVTLARIARIEATHANPVGAATQIEARSAAVEWSTWGTALAGFLAGLVTLPGTTTGEAAVSSFIAPRLGGLSGPVVDLPSTVAYTLVAAGALVLYGTALFAPLGRRSRS